MAAAIHNVAHPAGGRRPGTPVIALAAGGLFGVAQTLLAQRCGLLRFDSGQSGWWAVELVTLTWLSAVSVVFGVLVAGRVGAPRAEPEEGRRADPYVLGAAALGSLLAVPLATSSAAWAAIYGGAAPVWQSAVPVLVGIALGIAAGAVGQRSRAVALGFIVGSATLWAIAVLSGVLEPSHPPVLGHPDLGMGSAVTGQRTGAMVTALAYGAVMGVCGAGRRLQSRILMAVAGPGLAAAAFLAALPIAGPVWPW
ncbi:MAG: hypothetical protein WCA46_09550, partial [Actinocatenispora sp.]